jgi:nucleoside-diphosphate-sugar epimerase
VSERVLITGGLGFIGTAAAAELLARGQDVILTRHRTVAPARELKRAGGASPRVIDLDVSQPFSVLDGIARVEPSAIVHLATAGFRGSLIGELTTNAVGAGHILEAALRSGVARVVMASSIAVYEGLHHSPFREDDPLPVAASPDLPGVTKRIEELLALQWAARWDMDVRIARIPIVYGPGYRSAFNLPSRIVDALAHGHPLEGTTSVPFDDVCYIDDIAEALADLLDARDLNSRIFNLSSGRATDAQQVADVARAHGADEQMVTAISAGSWTGTARVMDPSRTASEVGWTSRVPYSDGFARYLEWTKAHKETP